MSPSHLVRGKKILTGTLLFSFICFSNGAGIESLSGLAWQSYASEGAPSSYDEYAIISQEAGLLSEYSRLISSEADLSGGGTPKSISITNVSQLAAYAYQGDIDITQNENGEVVQATMQKDFIFEQSGGFQARLNKDTEISTKSGAPFDALALGLTETELETIQAMDIENVKGSVDFGIPGQHLIFSKLVQIDIPTNGIQDGEQVQILVEHAGEAINTSGITTNPNASCEDGISSDENNTVSVLDNTATFYTCGASTFTASQTYISGAQCNAGDYSYEVHFTDTDNIGNYDVYDQTNGAVLATGSSSPITVTQAGNTSSTSYDIVVRDGTDATSISETLNTHPADCSSSDGQDTDGDGILNKDDLDDDNDGMLDSVECPAVASSLQLGTYRADAVYTLDNGIVVTQTKIGFGLNSKSNNDGDFAASSNSGLHFSFSSPVKAVISPGSINPPHFGTGPAGSAERLFYEIDAGKSFTVSNPTNSITVSEGVSANTSTTAYTNENKILIRSATASGFNPSGWSVVSEETDELSVTLLNGNSVGHSNVKIAGSLCTTDTDDDGKIDSEDLDSDNDGIPDNVEAQTTSGYIAPGTFTDANGDGVNDVYAGGLTPVNTDGTDQADYLDTDSDNQGDDDATESGLTLSGNVGDNGLDDGVESADDYSDVNGNVNTPSSDLTDTDYDGEPNYRDDVVSPHFIQSLTTLNVSENAGVGTYTIVLGAQPTTDVVIDLVSSDTAEGTVSPASLTFTNANWDTAQTVTVTGVNDDIIAVGTSTITASVDASSASEYTGLADKTVAATFTNDDSDNDNDGVSDQLDLDDDNDGILDSLEAAIPAEFPVNTSAGSANITTYGNNIEATLTENAWTSALEGYDISSVTSFTDYTFEYIFESYDDTKRLHFMGGLTAGSAASDNTVSYTGTDYAILIRDTSTIGASTELRLYENGTFKGNFEATHPPTPGDKFAIKKTGTVIEYQRNGVTFYTSTKAATASDYHIDMSFKNGTDLKVSELNLIVDTDSSDHDTDNDGIPNHLDLDSDNDGIPDNVEAQTTSGYIAPGTFTDANGDGVNDVYAGGLTPVNTDGTDQADYLDTDSDNQGDDDATESGLTLSGNVGDNGLDDGVEATDDYTDVNGNINNPLTDLSDTDSDSIPEFRDGTVTMVSGFTQSLTTLNVSENAGVETYTIVLDVQPTADVVIDIASSDTGEGTVSPTSLTFTNANWDTTQTVTVTGVNDDIVAVGTATITASVNASSASEYTDVTDQIVAATFTNDDSDNDNDGVSDQWDLDDDNDGILDVDEGGTLEGIDSSFFVDTKQDGGSSAVSGTYNYGRYANGTDTWVFAYDSVLEGEVVENGASSAFKVQIAPNGVSANNGHFNFDLVDALGNTDATQTVVSNAFIISDLGAPEMTFQVKFTDTYGNSVSASDFSAENIAGNGVALVGPVDLGNNTYEYSMDSGGVNHHNSSIKFTSQQGHIFQVMDYVQTNNSGNPDRILIQTERTTLDANLGSDTDGIPNHLDLDSDNDGIPDNVEAQTTSGYIAPGTFTDANGDGVNDVYAGGLTPVNTDGTDQADYLDTDSDNQGDDDATESGLTLTGNVGSNGLDDGVEATDDYTDVNGNINNPLTDLQNTDVDAERDYRDAIVTAFGFTQSTTTLSVDENAGTGTYTIVLDAQPTSDVVIDIASSDTGEGTVSPTSLTFTNVNWDTAQTVTVTGVDDFMVATHTGSITASINTSSASEYTSIASQSVAVTYTDDDVADIVVDPSGISAGGISITESSGTDSLDIVLGTQPTTDVVIDFTIGDTGEATVSPTSLTFTSANWNVNQTITLTAMDDAIDADHSTTLTISVNDAASDDTYDTVADESVSVTITDDDTAGFTQSTTTLTVDENTGTGTYTIVLDSEPTSDVQIDLSSSNTNEGTLSPTFLTFTPANWDTTQTITVTGVDDTTFNTTDTATITATINDGASANEYDPLSDQTVAVTFTDDDINIAPTDIDISSDNVDENVAAGTSVGVLSTSDADASDTHTYTLVSGTGSTDNALFTLSGSTLSINAAPDYETKSSYTIRVRTDDGKSGTYEEAITINVNDIDEIAPNPFHIGIDISGGKDNPILTFETTDNVGVDHYEVSIDGGAFVTQTSPYNPSLPVAASHSAIVRAYDAEGNYTQASIAFPPAVNIHGNTTLSNADITDATLDISGPNPITTLKITGTLGTDFTCGGESVPAGSTYTFTTAQATPLTCNGGVITESTTITVVAGDGTTFGNNSQSYVIDRIPPVITMAGSGAVTHEAGVSYTDAGATCSDNYDATCSVVVGGSVDTSTPGTYTITYNATDSLGNVATQVTRSVTIEDTTPPAAPTATTSPSPAKDGTTVTTSLTGVEEGATVSIPGMSCTPNPADATGEVTCTGTVGSNGLDGTDTTVTLTDAAGNTNTDTTSGLTADNTAPAAPTATTSPSPAKDGTTVTTSLTGVEEGATVSIPGMSCTPNPADATGAVTCTGTVGSNGLDGTDTTVTLTDAAGNTNTDTTSGLTADNTAPAAPTATTSPSPAKDGTTVTTSLTGVEEGATVSIPGMSCTPNPADATGAVTCTGTVGSNGLDGTDTTVTLTDAAGNTNTDTTSGLTADNTAPAAPTATTSPSPAKDGTTVTTSLTGVEEGATVSIPGMSCTPNPADATGAVTCTGTVGSNGLDGTDTTVTLTDAAGNTNTDTTSGLTADNTAPAAPTATTSPSPAKDGTTVTTSLTGVEEGATVSIPGMSCTPNPADATGAVTCTGTVGSNGLDGTDTTVTLTDAAGNTNTDTTSGLTADNTAPAAPTATTSPSPAKDGTTVTTSLTGVEEGATVSIPGMSCTPNPADATGAVTCTGTVGSNGLDGTDTTVTLTDAAGNTNTDTTSGLTADNTAPAAPTATTSPSPAKDGTTVTTSLTGVEEGATVSIPGMSCTPNPADATGEVTCTGTVGSNGLDGTDTTVTLTDAAGNTNTDTTSGLTADNTAPAAPTATTSPSPAKDGTTVTTSLTGVEEGATVSIPGMSCTPNPADSTGNVECTGIVGSGGLDGVDTTITLTDAAGNTNSGASTGLVVDNTAPNIAITSNTPVSIANFENYPISGTCTFGESDVTVTVSGATPETQTTSCLSGATWDVTTDVSGIVDGAEVVVINASQADTAGNEGNATEVKIDKYTAAFTQSETTLTVGENGGTGTYTIVLDTQPTSDVVIDLSSSDTAEGTVSPASLTFTPANWDTAQTVTVTGVDDNTVSIDTTIITSSINAATSANEYDNLANQELTATFTNDDNATIVVDTTGITTTGLTILEASGTGNFDVQLGTQPTNDVVIDFTSNDTGEATVSPSSLTFTNTNWNVNQTITLTAVDDNIMRDDSTILNISVDDANSDDSYDSVADETAPITIIDDDSAGFTQSTSTLTVDENAGTGTYTIVLDSEPMSDVQIDLSSSNTNEGTLSPTFLTFTPANWDTVQTVTVTGVDDTTFNTTDTGTITATINDAASSNEYTNIVDQNVTVTFTDDDVDTIVGVVVIDAPTSGLPITGTGEIGALIEVTTPSGASCSTSVQADGSWSCVISPNPIDGELVSVTQVDTAGNTSIPSTSTISLDTDTDGDGLSDLIEQQIGTDPSITDTDSDGTSDFNNDGDSTSPIIELAAPNNGDANGDNKLDAIQGHVSSIPNAENTNYNSLSVETDANGNPTGACQQIGKFGSKKEIQLGDQDINYNYSLGLWHFEIECNTAGSTADIEIYLDQIYDTSDWVYRKYDASNNTYEDISSIVTYTTVTVGNTNVTVINYSITDGGAYDEDGIANGVIVDPSGPAVFEEPSSGGAGGSVKYDICEGKDTSGSIYDGSCGEQEGENEEVSQESFIDALKILLSSAPEEDTTQIEEEEEEGDRSYTIDDNFASCGVIDAINDSNYSSPDTRVFIDESSFNNREQILKFSQIGIINGYEDGEFKAQQEMTRAEFLKVTLLSHCYDYRVLVGETMYGDVDESSWQAKVIQMAQDLGMIDGDRDEDGNKIFRPNDIITRAESIKILMKISNIQAKNPEASKYTDIMVAWHRKYIENGEALGLFDARGDNYRFSPEQGITREEMIEMIDNLVDLYR